MGHAVGPGVDPAARPLVLAEEGSFFVGGAPRTIESPYAGRTGVDGPGEITVGQMYVHRRVPAGATRPPIVLVHGSNHTGMTFETTPDGREGWATYCVRAGHPVYVVDHVGRGRSGFDPTPLSEAVRRRDASLTHDAPLYGRQGAWVNFRFGPRYPEPFPGLQFPLEAFDQYMAQLVPNAEELAAGRSGEATIRALAALLAAIGPAIVVTHSQAGLYGLELVRRVPDAVLALVSLEGGCAPLADGTLEAAARVPFLALWGDNSHGARGANGDQRREGARRLAADLRARGGVATFCLLPERGVPGNSHMMMMDRNSLEVAEILLAWLGEYVLRPGSPPAPPSRT